MDKNGLKSFIFEDWIGGLIIFQKKIKLHVFLSCIKLVGIKIGHVNCFDRFIRLRLDRER